MKTLTLTFTLVLSLLSSNAFGCAGCLDLYPETLVMSQVVTDSLITQEVSLSSDNAELRLQDLSCTKPNLFHSEETKLECLINIVKDEQDVTLTLKDDAAKFLFHQLSHLTAEAHFGSEASEGEGPDRTGERFSVPFKSQNQNSTTVSLPRIHSGSLYCPIIRGKKRCEITLSVLNVSYLYK